LRLPKEQPFESRTNHSRNVTCKLKKSQPHKLHIWFLPTLKANAQKTKRAILATAQLPIDRK